MYIFEPCLFFSGGSLHNRHFGNTIRQAISSFYSCKQNHAVRAVRQLHKTSTKKIKRTHPGLNNAGGRYKIFVFYGLAGLIAKKVPTTHSLKRVMGKSGL